MKRIWNMLRGRSRRDNKGMTFVEVICAVAILGLVSSVIGTVIVISTRTYNRGISETGIQQEAQLAANNIGNLVKDACSVRYALAGDQYLENGETWVVKADGVTPLENETGFTDLSIFTNDKIQYAITYDDTNSVLRYAEYDEGATSPRRPAEIIANNITAFSADTTDFKKSKTIKLNMTVRDTSTNKEIPMEYTMTSRNDAMEGFEYVASTFSVVLAFPDAEVVLVPGETYEIPLIVSGTLSEGLEWESTGALTGGALTVDYAEVTVPKDIASSVTSETIKVHTKDKNADGTYKSSASCTVLIRRVTKVEVTHTVNTDNATGHMLEAAGAEYTFSAAVAGDELAKRPTYAFDNNYKTAQAVVWSCVFDLNGTETAYDWTADPSSGIWTFAQPDFGASPFFDYFEVLENKEDEIFPSFKIKLKKALPSNFKLTVRATSKHALGVNKADSDYGDKDDTHYYGEDWIEPRPTKMDQGLEITLEPHESGTVKVGMKGGISSNVTFDFHDATDEGAGKTRAEYIPADDAVKITLGKDEMGSGPDSAEPYTFTVDVKADGAVKTTITVHVCRIDALSIWVKDNFKDNKGNTMALPTYDFRARFNVDSGDIEEMKDKVKNLIQYKEDGTLDEASVKKTLSSKITWEVINHNANGKVEYTKSVICMAGTSASDNGEVIGTYDATFEKGGAKFTIVNVKPARVEQDGSGNWYIKQLPEVDISPSASTPTGIPKNYEFKVTIRALHPSGKVDGKSYNRTDTAYIDTNVEASASILGDMTIDAPMDLIVVEPGQGTNSPDQSDEEMVVPIEVHGSAVYRMEAKLTGNTSKDTWFSNYSTEKKDNPYAVGNATSASQTRTWYLGLLIGKDEEGDVNGRIQVHVDAFNTNNEVIASTDFELGVRRVDKVAVEVADGKKIADVNKKGSTVKLEAFPIGRGSKGTEFYDIQKDEKGNTCRWEKKDHGEYKGVSPMEWTMLLNGDEKTEKPLTLTEWGEYFESITIKDSIDEKTPVNGDRKEHHKAPIEFKLKKPLPAGTKIRAYSLHVRGKVNDAKTNKSGREYEKKVYGEIEIGDSLTVADGFKRGKDYTFIQDIVNVRGDVFGWLDCLRQGSFYRYRESGGTWSKYHLMDSGETNWAVANYVPMSYLFRPDKEYEIEIVSVLYNKTDKLIYWPLDKDLLEKGRGWTEAGFTFWKLTEEQWQRDWPGGNQWYHPYSEYQELYNKTQAIPEVKQTFRIPKCEMTFNPRADASSNNQLTVDKKVTSAGSESDPIRLNGINLDKSDYEGFIVDLEISGYEMNTDQQCFRTVVQKKSGNQWITLGFDDESAARGEGFKVDSANPYISIYRTANAQGLYRVAPVIVTGEKIKWRNVTEISRSDHTDMDILFNPEYTTTEENYHLYDYGTGKYVIYFEFYR